MAYFGLITEIQNVRKDPNSDRLYLADCFCEGVIVGPDMQTGDLVLYLPTDGKIERWFGDAFSLFRKNEDGSEQGGYLENNGHVRAIKLRGNHSSGVVIPYSRIVEKFGEQNWKNGDQVNEINGKVFCYKYIPVTKTFNTASLNKKTSYKGRKAEKIIYPEFSHHIDTAQLAYNLNAFRPGDLVTITLKMHGTSQRSMNTFAELPNGFLRRLFRMKKRTRQEYVLGTRRTVVKDEPGGYYGSNGFRIPHHETLKPFLKPGMEVFYEVVGYYGENSGDTIMPIVDNKKLNDKKFLKQFGDKTVFSYGCEPGQSVMWIYRITSENGAKEWSSVEIANWCQERGLNMVPWVDQFEFTTAEDLLNRVNKYFEDLTDPIGKTHIKEGVVVRIENRRTFTAFKSKTYEFKVLEGIIKEVADAPDMEEQEDLIMEVE